MLISSRGLLHACAEWVCPAEWHVWQKGGVAYVTLSGLGKVATTNQRWDRTQQWQGFLMLRERLRIFSSNVSSIFTLEICFYETVVYFCKLHTNARGILFFYMRRLFNLWTAVSCMWHVCWTLWRWHVCLTSVYICRAGPILSAGIIVWGLTYRGSCTSVLAVWSVLCWRWCVGVSCRGQSSSTRTNRAHS